MGIGEIKMGSRRSFSGDRELFAGAE